MRTFKKELFFPWYVNRNGYYWIDSTEPFEEKSEPKPCLTDVLREGTFQTVSRGYFPLRDSGLFLTFCDTEPETDKIVEFAKRYGRLGGDASRGIWIPHPQDKTKQILGNGEPLDNWSREILKMRNTYRLFHLVQQQDEQGLRNLIQWDQGQEQGQVAVKYDSHPEIPFPVGDRSPDIAERHSVKEAYMKTLAWIASPHLHPELLTKWQPGEVFKPALYMVQRVINENLQQQASPRLIWNEGDTALDLNIVPHGLIGALWLQFADAVATDAVFRRCEQCEKHFAYGRGRGQKIKTFCSTACRSKAYRIRQEEGS